MSTATLATQVATQLTFPWAVPENGDSVQRTTSPTLPLQRMETKRPAVSDFPAGLEHVVIPERGVEVRPLPLPPVAQQPALTVAESLQGDRLCKPIRIGSVMFRLLKSYGISDEEIAEGIAAYTAKHG